MLRVIAAQVGDTETVAMADRILEQEHSAAKKLDGLLDEVALTGAPQVASA